MSTSSRDRVNGFYCAAAVLVAIALTHPTAESGVNDDWSYTKTALDLAQSGQLHYNGWAAAMVGAQAYWGAAFIKVFGFSFLVTRLSTAPLAAGCALLLYPLHRRAQLSAPLSIFGTLTITLSPVFIPHAASFMTEVPGFFLLLLSIFSYVRVAETLQEQSGETSNLKVPATKRAVLWLVGATVTGLLAGTVRQAFWVLPVLAPLYLILREQKGTPRRLGTFVLLSLSLVSLAASAWLAAWFYAQPYAIHERVSVALRLLLDGRTFLHLLGPVTNTWLMLGAITLPVFIAVTFAYPRIFARQRSSVTFGIVCLALAAVLFVAKVRFDSSWMFPWLSNTFTLTPYLNGTTPTPASAVSIIFPWSFWKGFSVFVIVLAFTAAAIPLVKAAWPPWSRLRPVEAMRHASLPLAFFGLFAAGYLPLLLLKSLVPGGAGLFDRYLLPLIPIVSIFGLRIYSENTGRTRPPLLGWLALSLAAYYGLAQTHDYFSLLRARLKLTTALEARAIPRTKIMGGFEYDGWTQITEAGYYNDPRIENPKIDYIPPSPLFFETQYFFWQCTPVVRADYVVSLAEHPDLVNSDLSPANYSAWLPPFHRRCLVQAKDPQLAFVRSLPLLNERKADR
jgi:hypothetical protein